MPATPQTRDPELVLEARWTLVPRARTEVAAHATGGPSAEPDREAHLVEPVIARAAEDPDHGPAAHRADDGPVDVPAAGLWGRARALARGLLTRLGHVD